jgi:hypothetical protein
MNFVFSKVLPAIEVLLLCGTAFGEGSTSAEELIMENCNRLKAIGKNSMRRESSKTLWIG